MKRMNNNLVLRRVHFIRLHSSLPVLHPAAIAHVPQSLMTGSEFEMSKPGKFTAKSRL